MAISRRGQLRSLLKVLGTIYLLDSIVVVILVILVLMHNKKHQRQSLVSNQIIWIKLLNARPFGLHSDGGYGDNLGYDGNNAKKKSPETELLVFGYGGYLYFQEKNIYVGLSY